MNTKDYQTLNTITNEKEVTPNTNTKPFFYKINKEKGFKKNPKKPLKLHTKQTFKPLFNKKSVPQKRSKN